MGKDNKIFQARQLAGLSRQQMSEVFNIPKRTIEDWESGKGGPPAYVEKMIIHELTLYYIKKLEKSDRKTTVIPYLLEEMDYMEGRRYLLACGYVMDGRYDSDGKEDWPDIKDEKITYVSEYYILKKDPKFDIDEEDLISWEYSHPEEEWELEGQLYTPYKLEGYWNQR